jgi:serine/threonine protein kinase
MPVDSSTDILTLSNTQAKELAGRLVTIGGESYFFNAYEKRHPGQPPWRSGAEGKAYPLLDRNGSVAAYLKFFTRPTQKRLDRTAWLIGQQIHTWLPHLAAAPVLWTDTRHGLHGAKIDFQFAAYLAEAVPGETWLERKSGIASGGTHFPDALRWHCVTDLLLALAALERAGLVHGDLSHNNVIIDLDAPPHDPALYLIDFDAFFAPAAGANRAVTVSEGGTYGTEGYCPPDLAAAASAGDGSAAPYSDRYGRDMLLLEFLLMGSGLPSDDPLVYWNPEHVQRQFTAWRARNDPNCVRTLSHLDPATVFKLSERERPTSVDLAIGLGLSLPERRVLRRVAVLPRPTPAAIGNRPPIGNKGRIVQESVPIGLRRAPLPTPATATAQPPRRRWPQIPPELKIELFDLGSFKSILIGVAIGFAVVILPLIVLGLLTGALLTTAMHVETRPATRPRAVGNQKTAVPETVKARRKTEDDAVSKIEMLGGIIKVDEKFPGRPVIGVDFGSTEVTDAGLEQLRGLTQLRVLNLSTTHVTDAGLEHVKGLTQLQVLSLYNTNVTDAGSEHLKGLTQLCELNLSYTQVTDAGLNRLKGLMRLQKLFLAHTPVTDAGLKHVGTLTQLQMLNLDGTRVMDAGLRYLKGLTQLRALDLYNTKVTGAGFEHLKGLKQLRELNAGLTQVTDAGLEHVRGLTQLQTLNFDGTEVTDAGLNRIKSLTQLQELDISGTKVTDAGVESLKKAMPHLIIYR